MCLVSSLGLVATAFSWGGHSLGKDQAPKMEVADESLRSVSGHIHGVAITGLLLE